MINNLEEHIKETMSDWNIKGSFNDVVNFYSKINSLSDKEVI